MAWLIGPWISAFKHSGDPAGWEPVWPTHPEMVLKILLKGWGGRVSEKTNSKESSAPTRQAGWK